MKNSIYPIELIEVVTEKDELNQIVEKERVKNTTMALISSVSQTEFFSGGRLGLQPSIKAIVYDFEYSNEPIVKWNNKLYSVYRTFYINGSDKLELYLEERGGTKDEPSSDDSDS